MEQSREEELIGYVQHFKDGFAEPVCGRDVIVGKHDDRVTCLKANSQKGTNSWSPAHHPERAWRLERISDRTFESVEHKIGVIRVEQFVIQKSQDKLMKIFTSGIASTSRSPFGS